jgi:hypothetical protein
LTSAWRTEFGIASTINPPTNTIVNFHTDSDSFYRKWDGSVWAAYDYTFKGDVVIDGTLDVLNAQVGNYIQSLNYVHDSDGGPPTAGWRLTKNGSLYAANNIYLGGSIIGAKNIAIGATSDYKTETITKNLTEVSRDSDLGMYGKYQVRINETFGTPATTLAPIIGATSSGAPWSSYYYNVIATMSTPASLAVTDSYVTLCQIDFISWLTSQAAGPSYSQVELYDGDFASDDYVLVWRDGTTLKGRRLFVRGNEFYSTYGLTTNFTFDSAEIVVVPNVKGSIALCRVRSSAVATDISFTRVAPQMGGIASYTGGIVQTGYTLTRLFK